MKKLFLFILILLSVISIYFYKQIVFDKEEFTKKFHKNINLKNDYIHYYYLVDENPIYVFKKNLFDNYEKWSFENKKDGLVFPQQQVIADLTYISTIQYAASFKDIFYAKFLSNEFNYITNLSPFWVDIYSFSQLILPASKNNPEKYEEKLENWEKTVKIGEKWVYFNCDKEKIKNILSLKDKDFFKYAYSKKWKFYNENKNPCKNWNDLEKYLAFNYMYYLKDYDNAIKYYKIASFFENSLAWTIGMVSVINSMAGEHEKAIYMFIQRLKGLENKLKNPKITEKEAKNIQDYYKTTFKRMQEELNLYIIANADKNWKDCKKEYKCLWEKWYIQKEIEKLINECKKVNIQNIKSITDIKWNTDEIIEKWKCVLLNLALWKWYIQKDKLVSPLLNSSYYWFDKKDELWKAGKRK